MFMISAAKTYLVNIFYTLLILGAFGAMLSMCSVQSREKAAIKPKGKSEFLYTVEGCNVYKVSDGNGENPALLTKCSNSVSIQEEIKDKPSKAENKIGVSNTTVRG